MKIIRSTKLSLKFLTEAKRQELSRIMSEYSRVVNFYITKFHGLPIKKSHLLKEVLFCDDLDTFLGYSMRQQAAREALDMLSSMNRKKQTKKKVGVPIHQGKRMCLTSQSCDLQESKSSKEYDAWLHVKSIGDNTILDLPLKKHDHFNELASRGHMLKSFIIHKEYVKVCFEIHTETKNETGRQIGIDTGIKALASTNEGLQHGKDVERLLGKIKRKKHGSNKQKKARRELKHYMDQVAKEVITGDLQLVVVEKLKNLNQKTKLKRRLSKNMRRSIGSWTYSYWLDRIKQRCEDNRVTFRSVPAYYTSQTCPTCDHINSGNRNGEKFSCLECGHTDNADINAAKNILQRFLSGPYGAAYQIQPQNVLVGSSSE